MDKIKCCGKDCKETALYIVYSDSSNLYVCDDHLQEFLHKEGKSTDCRVIENYNCRVEIIG